jgi:hypothetical protein
MLTFSEPIQRGTGIVTIKTLTGTLVESFGAATSGRMSIAGSTLTIDPTANLANGTAYRVEFGAGTFHDVAGNAYAGTTSYNFTTAVAATVDDFAATTATTGLVPVSGSADGRIESANDRDWFAVNLTAGQTYNFHLNSAATGGLRDPYLVLRDSVGDQLASNDDAPNSTNSLLTYTPSTTGTFYLEARDYNTGVGNYTVSAAAASSAFSITVNFTGNSSYLHYFTEAAQRWTEIIVGDIPDVNSRTRGLIDDLLIDASIGTIDGQSKILAQAGPTAIRSGGLPYLGVMKFDSADITQMVSNGTFGSVVLHEMGHVLGLGVLWNQYALVSSSDPYVYIGKNAVAEYDLLAPGTQTTVPLEQGTIQGTSKVHWSEAVFNSELMTGYSENSPPMPISIVTVGALADLGYQVNYAAADPFFF